MIYLQGECLPSSSGSDHMEQSTVPDLNSMVEEKEKKEEDEDKEE